MSVTYMFAEPTEHGPVIGLRCETCDDLFPRFDDDSDTAWNTYVAHRDTCDSRRFDVNVSNTNALAIHERLGLDTDPYADVCDPDAILAAAMLANIGRDDTGTHTVTNGNVIDFGVRPGYYDDRMGQIADLATEAKRRGLLVGWA